MSSEEVIDKVEETVSEQVEEAVVETVENIAPEVKVEPVVKEESPAMRNTRLLAKRKDEIEREARQLKIERDEALNKIKEYQSKYEESEDYDFDGKKAYKELKATLAQQQEQNQALINQMIMRDTEQKLVSKYEDFGEVASPTNISILKEADEKAIKDIIAEPDLYKKGLMTYDAIKKNKIYIEDEVVNNKETINKNLAKPIPAISSTRSRRDSDNIFANLNSKEGQALLRREYEESLRKI